jgi:hypothetical protein
MPSYLKLIPFLSMRLLLSQMYLYATT